MKESSWHARLYLTLQQELPRTICGYFWGWIVWLVRAILAIALLMAVLYLAVAYVHGWVMLFNGTLMTKHVSESFDDFSAFSWIVIHFFAAVVLIVYGLYFLYEIIGRQLKKPTLSKYCKPINWKQ